MIYASDWLLRLKGEVFIVNEGELAISLTQEQKSL